MTREYLPELDYYFNQYWIDRGEITVYHVPKPSVESITTMNTDSVFAMMFSVGYSHDYYIHYFTSKAITTFTQPIVDRLRSVSPTTLYYISDSIPGENILNLTTENITMLDKLLTYRISGTADISDITYADLTGKLSQLIYQYLNFMVNDEYQALNTSSPIASSDNLLDNLFELFVINEAHKKMKNCNIVVSGSTVILRPTRDVQDIDDDVFVTKQFETLEVPYSKAELFVFQNGDLLNTSSYNVYDTTNQTVLIDWESTTLDVHLGDTMIVDYYVEA